MPNTDSATRKHSTRREKRALSLLLLIYLLLAIGYDVATPYGEAPDEPSHMGYLEYLVVNGALPPIQADAPTTEAFQPPLYYLIGAGVVLTAKALGVPWKDEPLTPDLRGNVDARNGVDPKAMLYLHPQEERWPPWPYLLRTLSIVAGLGFVLLTYATARTLVPAPASSTVALLSAAFAAFIPQSTYIHVNLSNEPLTDLIAAWIVWLLVRHLFLQYKGSRVVWLGVALGLGMLTKFSIAPMVVPALWVLWIRREGSARRMLRDVAAVAGAVVLLAGWLFIYKWTAYGDPLSLAAWHRMLPSDSTFQIGQLFWFEHPFRWFLWSSWWGVFGWQRAWMPDWTYLCYLAFTLIGVGGGIYLLARRLLSTQQKQACAVLLATVALSYALVIGASTYLVAWQGREMFPSLLSVCVLLGLGFTATFGGEGAVQATRVSAEQKGTSHRLLIAVSFAVATLVALNVYALLGVLYPRLSLGQ